MAYKRVDGKKVAKGIMAAVALYYLGSLLSGMFDDPAAAADAAPDGDAGPTVWDLEDADVTAATQATPMPEISAAQPAEIETPKSAPVEAAKTAVEQQHAAVEAKPAPAAGTTTPSPGKPEDNAYGKWLSKLSPNAQSIIFGGMFGGASAALQGIAQKNAIEDARQREDRAREDKKRRGGIPAFGNGIIASRRA